MNGAEILERHGNWAVVQLPSRRFPELTAQGVTFHILAENVRRGIVACPPGDCFDERSVALEEMERALEWYADVLKQHRIELPWHSESQ